MAEMELEKQEEASESMLPSFVLKDVTNDPFFAGGNFLQGLKEMLILAIPVVSE